jgi:hypothetical protein
VSALLIVPVGIAGTLLAFGLYVGNEIHDRIRRGARMPSLRCSRCGLNYPHQPLQYQTCRACGEKTSWSSSMPNLTSSEANRLEKLEAEDLGPTYHEPPALTTAQVHDAVTDIQRVERLAQRSGGLYSVADAIWDSPWAEDIPQEAA